MSAFPGVSSYQSSSLGSKFVVIWGFDYQEMRGNALFHKVLRVLTKYLAELLDIQRSHISAIELGNVGVSLDLIFKMCEVFNIKPKELFDFRD